MRRELVRAVHNGYMKTITLAPGEDIRIVCVDANGAKTQVEIDDERTVHVSSISGAKTLSVVPDSITAVRITAVPWPS